ncbi:MAG: hypothetical protein V4598_05175 [Bdellovibrionota bacterium]
MPWFMMMIFTLITTASAFAIPVLALNDQNVLISGEISTTDYIESLRVLKETMDQKVVTGISILERDGQGWQLSKFSLGLGLTGEIGVGPFKYSSTLKQRFVYSR